MDPVKPEQTELEILKEKLLDLEARHTIYTDDILRRDIGIIIYGCPACLSGEREYGYCQACTKEIKECHRLYNESAWEEVEIEILEEQIADREGRPAGGKTRER